MGGGDGGTVQWRQKSGLAILDLTGKDRETQHVGM